MLTAAAPFTPAADGLIHLVPLGEFPNVAAGVVQVLDLQAVKSIMRAFEKDRSQPNFTGLLMDFDHFSCDLSKPSVAAGWIVELLAREDGIWCKVRWTDAGLAAVNGGQYRFVSPVFVEKDLQPVGGNRVRPLRLDCCGLTNQPNMKSLQAITNSARALPATFRTFKSIPEAASCAALQSDSLRNRAERLAKQRGWKFAEAWNVVRFADTHGITMKGTS